MPLTDLEAAMALPSTGWLKTYVAHGRENTTAPLPYHIGTGLALLAITCPKDYSFFYAGSNLYANMYCMMLGRSGEDQKTAALRIGTRLLKMVDPSYTSVFPGSREGLLDSLAAQPKQVMMIDELGDLLAGAQKGHLEPVKAALTALWDCGPMSRVLSGNRVVRVDDPRLTIAAACSIPYLENYTLHQDWHGGFMGRWFIMYGERKRVVPLPKRDDTRIATLQSGLASMLSQSVPGVCTGMTAQAEEYWTQWFNELNVRKLPTAVISIRSRGPTMALKIALLLGWDFGPARHETAWKIDLAVLEPAIRIAELHIKSLIDLSGEIAESPEARTRRRVLKTVQEAGMISLGELLGTLKTGKQRPLLEILEGLIIEGKVRKVNSSMDSRPVYEFIPEWAREKYNYDDSFSDSE